MRSIWVARHASTAMTGVRWSGRSDPPLTDAGVAEAAALASSLARLVQPPLVVVTSPARRALDTARAVAGRFGVEVELEPDLREVDLGQIDGLTFDEVGDSFPDIAAAALARRTDIDWPGGERSADFRARVGRAWTRLGALADDRAVVAVTHGGVIGELLRLALPIDAIPATWAAPASALHLVDRGNGWELGG